MISKPSILILSAIISLISACSVFADEDQPEIPKPVLEKLDQLRRGELNQLEKLKLADDLQRAGAKTEAVALYQENLPMDGYKQNLPPEAYLNYGTALLEKGEEKKGLEVYEKLNSSMDPKSPKTQKIKEMMEKNVVSFFQVQEQKKQQEKKEQKENKENKDKQDQKEGQSGQSGSEQKDQKGSGQKPQDQKDKKDQGKDPKDQKDNDKDKEENKPDEKDQDKQDKDKSPQDGEKSKLPPPKMPPKLKQLMSDDRQLQLKVIEQGTRDMNRRNSRENKDW
jgi:hypothetical protein